MARRVRTEDRSSIESPRSPRRRSVGQAIGARLAFATLPGAPLLARPAASLRAGLEPVPVGAPRGGEAPRDLAAVPPDDADRPWLEQHALPLAIGVAAGLAVASRPVARRLRRRLPEPIADSVVSAGMMAIGWGALAGFERIAPFRDDWARADDEAGTDVGYLTTVLLPTLAAARLGDKLLAGLTGGTVEARRDTWSTSVPLAVRVSGALLISELVHYWHHRLAHDVPTLRRFHTPHHSGRRMYWLNGLRFHPVDEVPLLALQTLALDLAGVDRDALLVHHVFKSINGMLQHANIAGRCGALNKVLSTAELHRLHHEARNGPATNYGAVLSLWDQVFGTQEGPGPAPFAGRIGLWNPAYPHDVRGQMLEPFRPTAAPR